ncbi:Uncharacterised protein [Vibrio cholerae]|nr:Uncharacterised protein [Vibrio cholerae]
MLLLASFSALPAYSSAILVLWDTLDNAEVISSIAVAAISNSWSCWLDIFIF